MLIFQRKTVQSIAYVPILKWDRNQPRVPKGTPNSGQWTSGGVSQGLAATTMAGRSPNKGWTNPMDPHVRVGGQRVGAETYSDILNAPTASGFVNKARITGQPDAVQRLMPQPSPPNATVTFYEEIGGGHANATYKVTLEDGTTAALKTEAGERWEADFWNDDIRTMVTNRDLPLAEREAIAFEVSEALGLDLVPETRLQERVHARIGLYDGPFETVNAMNDYAPHPNGGSLTKWIPGIDTDGQSATQTEIRRLAVLDYAMGQMDRHPRNVSFDANGKLLAMDNGYSLPDPNLGPAGGGAPDEFTFRSATTRTWKTSGEDFPEDERKQMADALDKTDWKAFVARHPGMSDGEREAFLGRISNLKEAMKTTTGLKELWANQTMYVDN